MSDPKYPSRHRRELKQQGQAGAVSESLLAKEKQ